MKNAVIYFSGTGNNLYVARKIAEGLGDTTVYPFKAFSEYENVLKTFDRIIFCVPTYHSHIPNYVQKMIERMAFVAEQKVYSVIVCGGNRGHAVEDLRTAVSDAGGHVCGEYMIVLPGSYILSYGGLPNILVFLENLFAKSRINKIVKEITHDTSSILKKTGLFYRASDEPRLQEAMAEYATIGENYTVSEQCVGCGACVRVCPVNNISMVDGKPDFGHDCQQCMACIQWCPNRAIDYENKASERKRYHHPEIRISDI